MRGAALCDPSSGDPHIRFHRRLFHGSAQQARHARTYSQIQFILILEVMARLWHGAKWQQAAAVDDRIRA
jgi:hypothetical protein